MLSLRQAVAQLKSNFAHTKICFELHMNISLHVLLFLSVHMQRFCTY